MAAPVIGLVWLFSLVFVVAALGAFLAPWPVNMLAVIVSWACEAGALLAGVAWADERHRVRRRF